MVTGHDEDLARDMCAAFREIEMLFGSLARQLGSAGVEHARDDLKRASRKMANVQERITSRLRGDGGQGSSEGEGTPDHLVAG